MKRTLHRHRKSIAASAVIGGLAAVLAMAVYDRMESLVGAYLWPVAEGSTRDIRRGDGWLEMRISIKKLRQECVFSSINAYGIDADGIKRDAYLSRIDMPQDGRNRPAGKHDIGAWLVNVEPVYRRVEVWTSHVCSGQPTLTRLLDIPLMKQ